MNPQTPSTAVRWPPVLVFLVLAIVLSSLWAVRARANGMLTNPQNAGIAAAVAQSGVLLSALVTMSLLARGAFRRVGWRLGPARVYLAVFGIVVALVILVLGFALACDFQRPTVDHAHPPSSAAAAIPFLLVFACLFAFAEEFGWRGFLLPELLPLGARSALLWSGALWFCWEAPLVYFGLLDSTLIQINLPVTLLCHLLQVGAAAVGFGYLRLRYGSVWLPTFTHGLLNALGGVSFLFFTETNPLWGNFGGPVGTAATLGVAAWVWRRAGRDAQRGLLP